MDRLPKELIDLIVYYVEGVTNTPFGTEYFPCQLSYPSPYKVPTNLGGKTLQKLRLVNRAFYSSASRALFRHVVVDIDADLSPKLSTIKNLDALIKDGLAPFVREIEFNVTYKDGQNDRVEEDDEEDGPEDGQEDNQGDAEEEAEEEEPQLTSRTLSPEKTEYLRSLLAQFPNLEAVGIGADQVPAYGDEIKRKIVVDLMFAQILYAVASLQDHNVVRLEMPVDCLDQLLVLLGSARFETFMRQLEHMTLDNIAHQIPSSQRKLELAVLDFSPQLLSLKVRDTCFLQFFPGADRVHQTLQLKAMNLNYMELTSHDLLGLLMRSKDTLKYVAFECMVLTQGSWLHVLIQMRKNFKLLELYFMGDSMGAIEDSPNGLYYENITVPTLHLQHALGDLQRQINANRLKAGLEPFTTETFEYLELRPLHTILPRDEWERWDSRTWEFVEDGNTE